MLEYGCGSAQWAARLQERNPAALLVGLDQSGRQLAHAQRRLSTLPLVQANGETLPLRAATFDLVFCDHGVMSWCDPRVTVPEAARVLRPGGRLVFNMSSPIACICEDLDAGGLSAAFSRPYFELHAVESADGSTWFNLPYGEWIRLFRANGLVVEDLVELRPDEGVSRFYAENPPDWHRRWPAENIWVTRRP